MCFRLVRPAPGGGGAGRRHGDGSDLHRAEERWKTPGAVFLRDHQVSVQRSSRPIKSPSSRVCCLFCWHPCKIWFALIIKSKINKVLKLYSDMNLSLPGSRTPGFLVLLKIAVTNIFTKFNCPVFFPLTEPVNPSRCRLMGNLGCRRPAQ